MRPMDRGNGLPTTLDHDYLVNQLSWLREGMPGEPLNLWAVMALLTTKGMVGKLGVSIKGYEPELQAPNP